MTTIATVPARSIAELGLIDEYELIVQPRLGHRPTLLGDCRSRRFEALRSSGVSRGAVAMRYVPRVRQPSVNDCHQ